MTHDNSYLVRIQRSAVNRDVGIAIVHIDEESGDFLYAYTIYVAEASRAIVYTTWLDWLAEYIPEGDIIVRTNDVRSKDRKSPKIDRIKYVGNLNIGIDDDLARYCAEALESHENKELLIHGGERYGTQTKAT